MRTAEDQACRGVLPVAATRGLLSQRGTGHRPGKGEHFRSLHLRFASWVCH